MRYFNVVEVITLVSKTTHYFKLSLRFLHPSLCTMQTIGKWTLSQIKQNVTCKFLPIVGFCTTFNSASTFSILNKFHYSSIRRNMTDIPTSCPQDRNPFSTLIEFKAYVPKSMTPCFSPAFSNVSYSFNVSERLW